MAQTVNGYNNDTPFESLDTALGLLDDYWAQFQSAQLAIESVTGPKEIDIEVNEMVDTENSYSSTKAKLKRFMKRYTDLENQQCFNEENQRGNQRGNHRGNQQDGNQNANERAIAIQPKLPKLEVPVFEGTFDKWLEFKDLFQSMVIDQRGITNTVKLQYLKVSAKGEADDIVSEYKINDANFDLAWEALKDRFDNKRLIVLSHLKLLFDQPNITTESPTALRLLLRTTQKCLRSLKSLGGPTEHWDWLLIYMIVVRLDPKTRRYWEMKHTEKEMATWDQLVKAMEDRCNALEIEGSTTVAAVVPDKVEKSSINKQIVKRKSPQSSSSILSSTISSNVCVICNANHDVTKCKNFVDETYDGRSELAVKNSLCFKCLKSNHNFQGCKAAKCFICGKKHHTLLHNPNLINRKSETQSSSKASPIVQEVKQNHLLISESPSLTGLMRSCVIKQVLLSTALMKVQTGYGHWEIVRAFLDGGSQSCVITQRCVKRLNLRQLSCQLPITGIGEVNAGICKKEVQLEIKSCVDAMFKMEINCVVMEKISSDLPNKRFDISKWSYIEGLTLADPQFNEPGNIDILIGAEYFFSLLLKEDKIDGPVGYPSAVNTVFDWILSGPVNSTEEVISPKIFNLTIPAQISLDKVLTQFWEIEEIPECSIKSLEDEKCEKHFDETHCRDEEGRFVVRLPFNEKKLSLGESKSTALKRFHNLESQFAKDQKVYRDYVAVMRELQSMNHMKPASQNDNQEQFFMPHHPVIKPFRLTTKMRVVMDAAAKSSNGVSLNDKLRIGPRLQQDLLRIIIRFRSFKVMVSADIEKMFRQILIHEDDQRYQKILWREKVEDPIQEYEMTTVTFGTSSAPFLAIKALQTLASENEAQFPKLKKVIVEDFYMDDLLTGGDHADEVIELVQDLQKVLKAGKFPLRKWISNDNDVLKSIDEKVRAFDNVWNIPFEYSDKTFDYGCHC